jgi:predicted Zn-dependent protease
VNKRRIVAAAVLVMGCAALYVLQKHKVTAEISPRPILYLVADTEREAERIPLALTRVSDKEENEVGAKLAQDYGLLRDQPRGPDAVRISNELQRVGLRVAAHVRRKGILYHFYFLDERSFVNAFALPGGHIVVGRGLLALMESEDELAAVLGHEITHVDNRHAIERLQYELASRKLGLGSLYSLGSVGIQIFQAGYTKDQELEADRVGLDFAVAAGYSPAGATTLMQRFEKLESGSHRQRTPSSVLEEAAQVSSDSLREYFRSHPPAGERVAALQAEIRAHHWNPSQAQQPLSLRAIFLADAADALDRKGDFKGSIQRYQEALQKDRDYARAWRGLANVSWRSGDAIATVTAATEAVRHMPAPENWVLLGHALGIADLHGGASALRKLAEEVNQTTSAKGLDWRNLEIAGLQFLAGRSQAFDEFRAQLLIGPPDEEELAGLERDMAWWMYRAGKLEMAQKELESARQSFPQIEDTSLQLAWVLTDLGRQADAETMLKQAQSFPVSALKQAAEAVVKWRTGRRDEAKNSFRLAAQNDPAWMVQRWVENSYSQSAANIIRQLQASEIARRQKEQQERQRQAGN